jgi:hypothetical protein
MNVGATTHASRSRDTNANTNRADGNPQQSARQGSHGSVAVVTSIAKQMAIRMQSHGIDSVQRLLVHHAATPNPNSSRSGSVRQRTALASGETRPESHLPREQRRRPSHRTPQFHRKRGGDGQ